MTTLTDDYDEQRIRSALRIHSPIETLKLMYDGPAVEYGGMEISDLLTVLSGISSACTRSLQLLSEDSTIKLHVRLTGVKQNCFLITLLIYAAHLVTPALTAAAHATISAAVAAAPVVTAVQTVVSVAQLIHELKGTNPEAVHPTFNSDGTAVININNLTLMVPPDVWRAFSDGPLRAAVEKVLLPLKNPNIHSLELNPGHSETIVLTKENNQHSD